MTRGHETATLGQFRMSKLFLAHAIIGTLLGISIAFPIIRTVVIAEVGILSLCALTAGIGWVVNRILLAICGAYDGMSRDDSE